MLLDSEVIVDFPGAGELLTAEIEVPSIEDVELVPKDAKALLVEVDSGLDAWEFSTEEAELAIAVIELESVRDPTEVKEDGGKLLMSDVEKIVADIEG